MTRFDLEEQAAFGLAIIEGLLTDSQLDFRRTYSPSGKLGRHLLPNESVREVSIRIFKKEKI
jgi:hypothetical protein